MKKIKFYVIVILCYFTTNGNAQFYSQGDIQLMFQPTGSHDSSICGSQIQLFYAITIQNSFVGDSVQVKDMFNGIIIYQEVNISGQNPWNVFAPNFMASGFISDNQVAGGFANLFAPPSKVISGSDTIYNIANFYSLPVPNPCSYGNITGKIYVDYNNDCVFNGTDVPLISIGASSSITLNSPSVNYTTSSAYSDGSGNYNMQIQESWMTGYNVSIPSQYQFIFPLTTCSPAYYNFNSLPQSNVDFSLQCSSNLDIRCAIGSNGIIRPGIPFTLFPYVNNTGCNATSGVLKLVLDPNVVYDAALSSNPASSIVGDTLFWNYSNLSNLSNGMYWNSFFGGIYLTPSNSVNIGDTLCFQAFADVPIGDVDNSNNTATICLPVVNSYDPNMKEVSPRGTGVMGNIPPTTTELNYTIHFQNTGTAPAYNISIVDTLDSPIQTASLEILGTSHAMIPQWIGTNIVKFNYYNISLPDSTSNEANSHGFVSFKVKLNNALPAGTMILNKANIFFDSNPSIVTNTTTNTISLNTGIEESSDLSSGISVYPNPFTENTTIVINNYDSNKTYSIELIDVFGKRIQIISSISSSKILFSRRSLKNGIYFIKVYDSQILMEVGKLVVK